MKMVRINKIHFLFLFLLLIIFNVLYPYEHKTVLPGKGDIASRDIIAPYSFNILKTEEELNEEREKEALRVPPILKFIEIPGRELIIKSLDSLINNIASQSNDKWKILRNENSIKNIFIKIIDDGVISDKSRLSNFISDNFLIVKEDTSFLVHKSKIRNIEEARRYLEEQVVDILGEKDVTQRIVNSIQPFITPNLLIDFAEIENRQEEARNMVKDSIGYVRKGEKIVGAHEVITKNAFRRLYSLSQKQAKEYPYTIFSKVLRNQLYFLLVCLFILIFLYVREKEVYEDNRLLYLFLINMFLILLLRRFVPLYLLPLASIVMFLTLAVNLEFGILFAISSCLVIFLYQGFTIAKIIPVLTGSLVGGILLIDPRNRTDWYRTGAIVAVTTGLLILSIEFFNRSALNDVLIGFGYGLTNGFISVLLLFALLFVFERVFDVTTNFTWMEYQDLNNPILKRLSQEAPGTYQHSLMVSTLAENAAQAIGANALLSKVGGLYHDIGKLTRPDFFAENFRENNNPHETIPPKLSAIIIKSHIQDGINIAKEFKLPRELVDVIKQHQGTYLIVPFYEKAKKHLDSVNEEDYKYDAELPISKETGILMLADIVEATAKSMENPSEEEIKDMINKQINKQFTRGQLSKSELSIKDLNIISNQFAQTLEGLYHYRPTYPETE